MENPGLRTICKTALQLGECAGMNDVSAMTGIAGLLVLGAITPGPNNLIVLRMASLGGMRRALPAMAGVVLGGLLLLVIVALGGNALFTLFPVSSSILLWSGCAYLIVLALRWIAGSFRTPVGGNGEEAASRPHAGMPGLLWFQFANPKSWVLVTTSVSAASVGPASPARYAWLVALFVVLPSACLLFWAFLGSRLMRKLQGHVFRSRFERVMGVLLACSAAFLLIDT